MPVADPGALAATVDRFLDELDGVAPADRTLEVSKSVLRSASRDAQAALVQRFDDVSASLSADRLPTLSDELTAVVTLLEASPSPDLTALRSVTYC